MEEPVDCIANQFVGSAVIIGASYGVRSTLLHLQTFTGERIDYSLGGIPDDTEEGAFRSAGFRPISVKIRDAGRRCSVIGIAADGPRRSDITLESALALYESGVHAVVDGGLPLRMPCPTAYRSLRKVR